MRFAVVLVLGACGGSAATPDDAPPADAGSKCPPIGTLPRFEPVLHRAVDYRCENYSAGSGVAIATCTGLGNVEGPDTGASLVPALGLAIADPRIFAEGDRAIGTRSREIERHVYETTLHIYRHTDAGWGPEGTLPIKRIGGGGSAGDLRASTVTWPLPERRVVIGAPAKPEDFTNRERIWQEWSESAAGWTPIGAPYTTADLGIVNDLGYGESIYLTSDGLRMFIGSRYTDRPDLSSRFRPLVAFEQPTGFMTEDCRRLYLSGLDGIFYMEAP